MNDNQFKGLRIRFDDAGCTSRVGNQFVGVRTQWWRMHKRKLIHGAPNKMVENARTALGNQFVGLRTQWWRMHERQSIHGAPNKI